MQIMKLNPKMGFWRAKHGLSKHRLKRPKLVSNFGGEQNVKEKEKRRGRGRRRREEEEEEIKQKGMESNFGYGTLGFCMETHLDYAFYAIWHGSLVLYDYYLASNLGFVRISS